jgi:hypothetical protein
MANIIRHKRSAVAGNAPTAAQLDIGELAINFADQLLYTEDASANIIELTKFRNQSAGLGASTDRKIRIGSHAAPVADLELDGNYTQTAGAGAAGAFNCSVSNFFTATVAANTTFSFTSVPTGVVYSCTIQVTHTSGAIAWPVGTAWPYSLAPILTSGKVHLFQLVTADGGTTWLANSLVNY